MSAPDSLLIDQRAVEEPADIAALRASEAQYRTLFDSLDEGFCVIEMLFDADGAPADYRFLRANPAFEAQTGLHGAMGRTMRELAPDHEQFWFDTYGRIALTGVPERFENAAEALDRWYDVYAFRVGTPEQRQIEVLFRDVLPRKRIERALRETEERQAFLLRLSDAMRSSADVDAMIAVALRLLCERLGALRVVFGEVDEEAGIAVFNRGWTAVGADLMPTTLRVADFDGPLLVDLRAGRTIRYDDVGDPPYARPDFAALAAIGVRAGLSVPLVTEGRFVAILSVHHDRSRRWAAGDIALMEDVAERMWSAVERARAEAAVRASEEKYRTLFESIDEGFCIVETVRDEHGRLDDLIYREANGTYVRHAGFQPYPGLRVKEMTPNIEDEWMAFYDRVSSTGVSELKESYNDDLKGWFRTHASRIGPPGSPFLGIVFEDVTERKRAEAVLRESEERQSFLLKLSDELRAKENPETVADCALRLIADKLGLDGCYLVAFDFDTGRADFLHQHFRDGMTPLPAGVALADFPESVRRVLDRTLVVHDAESDPTLTTLDRQSLAAIDQRSFVAAALRLGERNPIAAMVATSTAARQWTRAEIALIEGVAERAWQAIEHARAEAAVRDSEGRLRTVVAELQHRVRNILTVVRSVFSRTVEMAGNADEMADHFRGRLDALARTQVVRTRNIEGTADLENLIRDELLSVGVSDGPAVTIDGPDVTLPARTIESMGLAIHELVTNALKYGALKEQGGTLDISWRIAIGYEGKRRLVLTWREGGVPALMVAPTRRGFGSELLTEALPYRLGAETRLEFLGGGIRCTIDVPLPEFDGATDGD